MNSDKDYKVLGKGSYGIIVSPAVNNINDTGKIQKFPDMVTKIMTKRSEFRNALRATESIQTDVPSLSLNFIPYTKKYSASNFKNIPEIANYLNKQRVRNTNNVYLARMPNLGHSCRDIFKNPELYRKYRELGTEVYCREILKLFKIVKDIKDARYVHADIRETNVMCNINTGILTIIDFDWFRGFNSYYEEYPTWFYSHPPEEFLLFDKGQRLFIINDFDKYIKDYKDKLDGYMKVGGLNDIIKRGSPKNLVDERHIKYDDFVENYTKSMKLLFDEMHSGKGSAGKSAAERMKIYNDFKRISFNTIDSYGLAISLYSLFYKVLVAENPFSVFLYSQLLKPMLGSDYRTRMTIEEAIITMEEFIKVNIPSLERVPDLGDELKRLSLLVGIKEGKPISNIIKNLEKHNNNSDTNAVKYLASETKKLEKLENVTNNKNTRKNTNRNTRKNTNRNRNTRRNT